MRRAKKLIFQKFQYKKTSIRFYYVIDNKEYSFYSSFPQASVTLTEEQKYLVAANIGLSFLLDLAAVCLPETVIIQPLKLSEYALSFWKETYKGILLERIYEYQLPIEYLHAEWIITGTKDIPPFHYPLDKNKVLLAMSGGKESLTALKMFERGDVDTSLFFLHYPDKNWFYGKKAYEYLQKRFHTIKISSNITSIGKLKKQYDCKGIGMFVIGQLVFQALMYSDQFPYFVIGNEYSSNFGNGIYQGEEVNHQFDKTISFAQKINDYVRSCINTDFLYFSPFFGFHEYKIAEIFFSDPKYFSIWTSCNQSSSKANFCCQCPKCAFTYMISLPYSTKEFLSKFFHQDIMQNVELCKPLLDINLPKPLECVGEKKEAWLALYNVYQQKKDISSPVMIYFIETILPSIIKDMKKIEQELMSEKTDFKYIPASFRKLMKQASNMKKK